MTNRILICTDLDRTLLPNGTQQESPSARDYFALLVARKEIFTAYVSGRNLELVAEAIKDYCLPSPDWIIGDVGTTIYYRDNGIWRYWRDWEKEISCDWRDMKAQDMRLLFEDIVPLRLQEESKQNTYKLSYYLPIEKDFTIIEQEMSLRLKAHRLDASLIYSFDEAANIGLLDVLPARATKLHAIEFLMLQKGFDVTHTVFAGDSGNDLPVLVSRIPSVLVANAASDVVDKAKIMATELGTSHALYLAKGNFMGMNGNYCAGIIEGIVHFLPEIRLWLENA